MRKLSSSLAPLGLAAAATLLATPALADDGKGVAWQIVAGLTTEIGQRLDGTPREAAARDWAVARLKALGFANVHAEGFTIPGWERGEEQAALTAPVPQKLAITALGDSGATPAKGLTAELVYFPTLAALKAAPDGSLKGRIAFIDHAMLPAQDGLGYGPYGNVRRAGPAIAASKGASAIVIRSIGTDHNRDPHTGVITWPKGVTPIPAGAVSSPDASLIARTAAMGRPMTLSLLLTPRFTGPQPSGNVIAELPGTNPQLPPILIACHLDSWDLATGAIDNASGCGIITGAALQAASHGPLLRTIRLLWAGSEERGGFGGIAYAKAHGGEPHALAMESDFGADKVWATKIHMAEADKALADKIVAALEAVGIPRERGETEGGTDVETIAAQQKLAVIDLMQDGTHYFDLHHTPDDTLDKVDPAALQQNVDAWAVVLGIVGNEAGAISPAG